MAGGDHHPGGTAQFPHGKGRFRGGADIVKEERCDPVGRQYQGRLQGEFPREVPGVVSQGHPARPRASTGPVHQIGQTLGSPPHQVAVHTVQAGSQDSPHPPGTEGQFTTEALGHGIRCGGQLQQLDPGILVQSIVFQPAAVAPFRFSHLKALPPVVICIAYNVILSKIISALHLDQFEHRLPGVLEAVARSHGDMGALSPE